MTGPLRSVLALRRLIGNIRRMGRVSRYISFVAVTAALLVPMTTGAAAKEPLRLTPSSKWNVHYADDSCRLGRSFGTGDQTVILLIERYQPDDSFRMSFVGKPVDTNWVDGDAQVRFGPAGKMQAIPFYPATNAAQLPGLILRQSFRIAPRSDEEYAAYKAAVRAGTEERFVWPTVTPEQEAAVTFIELRRPVRHPLILETGSMGAPFAALRKCTDELLDHWGIDVAKHATLSRPAIPKSKPSRWLSSEDYPPAMLAAGKRAIVNFRLNVDATGKTTACHIQDATHEKSFEDVVCKAVMRKASFEPALDAEGNPLASYWINTVMFHM